MTWMNENRHRQVQRNVIVHIRIYLYTVLLIMMGALLGFMAWVVFSLLMYRNTVDLFK